MDTRKSILLIHGAGLGNFIWDDMIPMLNYPALMAEYPNRNGGDTANAELTLDEYVDPILAQINEQSTENWIIVTHSIGGVVGLKVAEKLKNSLIGFIGIASAIPIDGNSFVSCLPFPKNIVIPLILRLAGTKPPKSVLEKGLCNDLSPAQTNKIVENFTPESKRLYTDKSGVAVPETNTLYIKLINDNEFPMSLQKRMAENLKAKQTVTIESGHLPMLSKPKELARAINEFCKKA